MTAWRAFREKFVDNDRWAGKPELPGPEVGAGRD
jgi:hypothetical protein